MGSKEKLSIVFLILIAVIGFVGYNYVLHGGERNLATEKADFTISSKEISNEFSSNIDLANKKYLEKAVAISGKITAINDKEIILDNVIICNLNQVNSAAKISENTVIKGRIVGFDDLMGELKLDQCVINK